MLSALLLFSHSLCLTLCDPMAKDCSTPGFHVPHHLLSSRCLPEIPFRSKYTNRQKSERTEKRVSMQTAITTAVVISNKRL